MFDLDTFRATKRTCDDEMWAQIKDDLSGVTQDICLIYADGYLIHVLDGKYFVHAWWYSPIAYDTLEEAEAKLYPWYCEFAT